MSEDKDKKPKRLVAGDREKKRLRFANAAEAALRQIVAGVGDPRAMAEAALAFLEDGDE